MGAVSQTRSLERRIELAGQDNFRDLGGYRTRDGRALRWGRLYRSDALADLSDDDLAYLEALGAGGSARTAGELWRVLLERHALEGPASAEFLPALELILSEGCLAQRIVRRLGAEPSREQLRSVYRELAGCLREGSLFRA